MIVHKLHLLTKIDIFAPKYSGDNGWRILLAKYRVHHGSSILIINFTKAKHLKGQRFAIRRDVVQRCEVVTNGRISCYSVPFDLFESWETPVEARNKAFSAFDS